VTTKTITEAQAAAALIAMMGPSQVCDFDDHHGEDFAAAFFAALPDTGLDPNQPTDPKELDIDPAEYDRLTEAER